ncbi:MAG TPA: protein translocase subunit SecD [Candidatus Limiplasma sp.]|nr:protein translocase subunit SecD [Candidatus Limiplasma sp.]HRX09096.1 protein translocase subunit SecD [Candidatus Limiplasma sp.]
MKVTNRRRIKLNKRTSSMIALAVLLVVTVFAGYVGLNGMNLDSRGLYKMLPWIPQTNVTKDTWPASIALGLDLQGGVFVEYEATMSDELKEEGYNFDQLLDNTMEIIGRRLSDKGFTEATVSQLGVTGIRVEIPDVTDPAAVLDLIGSPAKLEFLDYNGNVFLEGRYLKTATRTVDENSKPAISFQLTSEGAQIFGDMTAKSIGKTITIQLDGQELMSPSVHEAIYGGSILVTGSFTEEQADNYALQLQSGSLPLDLRQDRLDTVSATLGDDALGSSVNAAIIGILLVMLIMVWRYRLSGLLADWALCLYIILLFLFIAVVPGIQLTLPGIAGIILGIGMAVDANVVIFERVKEEALAGRPILHAVRIGFKNAMSAVVDANITTIIAAIVLLFFGTGSVQGFATTLLLSVVASMITAIIITRFLLTHMARILKNPKLYMTPKKMSARTAATDVKEAK